MKSSHCNLEHFPQGGKEASRQPKQQRMVAITVREWEYRGQDQRNMSCHVMS